MILCVDNSIQETEFEMFPPLGNNSQGNRSIQKGISQITDRSTSAYIPAPFSRHENNHANCSFENSAKYIFHSNALITLPLLVAIRHGMLDQANSHSLSIVVYSSIGTKYF